MHMTSNKLRQVLSLFALLVFAGIFQNCSIGSAGDAGSPPNGSNGDLVSATNISLNDSESWPSNSKLQRGVLHSTAPFQESVINSLGLTSWRLGDLGAQNDIKSYNLPVTQVISDLYMKALGTSTFAPWNNWDQYESICKQIVQYAVDRGIDVTYWEIANEVDSLIPAGTDAASQQEAFDRYRELTRRTIRAVRSVKPTGKIVGFGLSSFDSNIAAIYLDFLKSENLKIDAFAWHVIGNDPIVIGPQVTLARQLIAARGLSFEIHIGEFLGGQHHLIPAWNLAYLAALHEAHVESYSRACWHRTLGGGVTSECVSGLDGLLLANNSTLTRIGALYAATTAMFGPRLKSILPTGDGRWAGLLSFDSAVKRGTLIIGSYSCGAAGKWCVFTDTQVADRKKLLTPTTWSLKSAAYAGRTITLVQKVIRNENLEAGAGVLPVTTQMVTADAQGAFSISVAINDGDVMIVEFSSP